MMMIIIITFISDRKSSLSQDSVPSWRQSGLPPQRESETNPTSMTDGI